MEGFICKRCGKCCTDIGGRFSYSEVEVIRQAFKRFERYGLYLAIEPNKFSIPLSPEEKEVMQNLAKELKIPFNPIPKLVFTDEKGNHEVIEWDLGSNKCPFYSKKKGCLIYENRPLACKSFPVIAKPDGYELLDLCPETKKVYKEEIETFFPEECRYARDFMKRVNGIKEKFFHENSRGISFDSDRI